MLSNPPANESVKKIGVLMYGLLGDTLMRTPLLRELRALYADACIVAFVDPVGSEALALTKLPDKVVVLDRRKKPMRLDILARFAHIIRMRLESFDLMIDLYMGASSQLLATYSGARYKIFSGFEVTKNSWGGRPIPLSRQAFENPYHYSNSCLNSLKFLTPNAINLDTRPELDIDRFLTTSNSQKKSIVASDNHFFLISLGAGDPKKVPEIGKLAVVCKYVYDVTGYIPTVIQNPGQESLQASLVNELLKSGTPNQKLDLLNLEQIAVAMMAAKFVILPDSGLFHVAVGLGVNILAVFTHTNPELVRPKARNCTIIFDADKHIKDKATNLSFGSGTPSTERLLAITAAFLDEIRNSGANHVARG
jgi:ADP-heptose:LPS heptosyltransferase